MNDTNDNPSTPESMTTSNESNYIPCESIECQMEGRRTHDSEWIVSMSCCHDTEAWCQRRVTRYVQANLHDPAHATTGVQCQSCGQLPSILDWAPTRDLGMPPSTP